VSPLLQDFGGAEGPLCGSLFSKDRYLACVDPGVRGFLDWLVWFISDLAVWNALRRNV